MRKPDERLTSLWLCVMVDVTGAHLRGRRVRSRRSTRRIPRMRFPPEEDRNTRMSTMDTKTSMPSKTFQVLWR